MNRSFKILALRILCKLMGWQLTKRRHFKGCTYFEMGRGKFVTEKAYDAVTVYCDLDGGLFVRTTLDFEADVLADNGQATSVPRFTPEYYY